MKWLNNIRMKYKILCLILIAALGMAAITHTGYRYILSSEVNMDLVSKGILPSTRSVDAVQIVMRKIQAGMLEAIAAKDQSRKEKMKKDLTDVYVPEYEAAWKEFKTVAQQDPAAAERIPELEKDWEAYRATAQQVMDLAIQGKADEASSLYTATGVKQLNAMKNVLLDLQQNYEKQANAVTEEMDANASHMHVLMIVIALFSVVVLLGAGLFIIREITNALATMKRSCEVLAQGDFSEPKEHVAREDEFGEMADVLRRMRSNLKQLIEEIGAVSDVLTAASQELTTSASQSAQASNQVADAIGQAADAVTQQQVSVSDSAQAVTKVAGNVQEIENNAGRVAENSGQAAARAQQGNQSVDHAVSQMRRVEETVQSSAGIVDKLGERSQEIGQIVDTISGIASQTNLLALNAAIEAARAGEHGRGFAVVADEVRKLAEQSQEAAQRIAELITGIQQDTDLAVDSMREGREKVVTGTQAVEGLRADFGEITQLVNRVSEEVRGISQAIDGVAVDTGNITKSVEQIKTYGESVSGEMQSVSAAAQQQNSSTDQIAAASQALTNLAMELHQAVQAFKV